MGREEWINFTLERRGNCHLRICGGISLFSLLFSQWRVTGENIPSQRRAHSLLSKQRRSNWNHSFYPHGVQGHICCLGKFTPSPSSPLPAARQQSITHGSTLCDWHPQSIDILIPSSSSSLDFQCGCKALKQNIRCNEALFMAFLDSLLWS